MTKSAAGDVAAAVAGEEHDEVGDLVGPGEPAGRRSGGGLLDDGAPGRVARPGATVAATPPSPSHRSVSTGPGLTVLTRTPRGPTSFDSDLQKLVRAALAAL